MKENIMLLSALKFKSKNNGNDYVRLDFIFSDKNKKSNSANGKGYFPQVIFADNLNIINELPFDIYGKTCLAHIQDVPNTYNPLRLDRKIVKIEYDGKVFDLV